MSMSNVSVPTPHCDKGFLVIHVYIIHVQTFGQRIWDKLGVKLENILNAHSCMHINLLIVQIE